MKYYQVTVTLKTGFKYSYTCIGRMLEGMKRSSEGYWTESVVSQEITEEEFRKTREVTFEPEKATEKKVRAKKHDNTEEPVVLEPVKATTKRKPKMASLENFFGEDDGRPSIPTKETSRNKKTDTVKKVRARRST